LTRRDLNVDPAESPVLGRAADDRGGVRAREIMLRKKDGTAAVFLESSRAVWDAAGKLIRYQGTLVDVTERRKLERQVLQQEEFRRRLLESFPDLILVVDLEERYTFRELPRARPARIPARGSVGQEDFGDRGPLAGTGGALSRCGFGNQDLWIGGIWRSSPRWKLAHHAGFRQPVFDADAKLGGVIVSVRDITTEKKLEQQIVQSERLAAMGAMIGGVAHELNNPLTSILGVSELLQDSQTTDAARKQIGILQQQARRAAEIVHNLTYFSRPPAPGKTPVNLGEVVERTLNLHAYSLRKNNITVDFLREPGLPYVEGDPHQLMQVFLNLILNAEQAIREARDRGTLRIRLGNTGDSVWASFSG
jgi:signal transduction histidine kinase